MMPQSLKQPAVRGPDSPDEQQGGTKHRWPAISAALARTGRADPAARPGRQDGQRSRPLLTARGAVAAMLLLFLAGNLSGTWLHAGLLAGLSFAAGCVLAVCYTRRADLLLVVATPPLIFAITSTCAQLLTAPGDSFSTWAESVAAGVLLTLAAAAPWLLGGVAAALVIATVRGLPACLASLRADLRAPARPGS
jgi:hypothetical protein